MFTYAITIASAQLTCFSMMLCIIANKLTFLYHSCFKNPQKNVWEVLLKRKAPGSNQVSGTCC